MAAGATSGGSSYKERYLLSIIGDEDSVTGILLAGIGQVEAKEQRNYFMVDNKTSIQQIQTAFSGMCTRRDIAIVLINQHVADEIRDLIEEHQEANAFPVVLEIPSKEHPYDPEKDSVIKKIQRMFAVNYFVMLKQGETSSVSEESWLQEPSQKISPVEVKKWHRTIIKSLNELHFQNTEELCTGALFSMLAEKHLFVTVDQVGQNDIHSVSNCLEQLMKALLGVQSSIIQVSKNTNDTIIPEFLIRDDTKAFYPSANMPRTHSVLEGMDFLANKRAPSESHSRPYSMMLPQQHIASSSSAHTKVASQTGPSPISPATTALAGHEFVNRRDSSSCSSSPQKRRGSTNSVSVPDHLGGPKHSEAAKNQPKQFQGNFPKKCANCVIIEFYDYSYVDYLRDVMQVLADKHVKDNGSQFALPKFFLLVIVAPSSIGTSKIPRYLVDKLFYNVRVKELPSAQQVSQRQPLLTYAELEMITQHLNEIYCSPEIWRYVQEIILNLKRHPLLCFGLSGKSNADLLLGSRIAAMMLFGSDHIIPEHIWLISKNIVGHRLLLKSSYGNSNVDGKEEAEITATCVDDAFTTSKKTI